MNAPAHAPSIAPTMPGALQQALHERTYATNETLLRPGSTPQAPYAAEAVDNEGSGYVEFASDHRFTAFLAQMTPSRALRDRELTFSKAERKHHLFLRRKASLEAQTREETA